MPSLVRLNRGRIDGSPRRANVLRAMRAEGLVDTWVRSNQMCSLLSRYPATRETSCWTVFAKERLYDRKDGTLWCFLEDRGMAPDPALAIVECSGALVGDVREVVLELQMSLGAHGASIEMYPVPGLRYDRILVRVADMGALFAFLRPRERSCPRGRRFVYFHVRTDDFGGNRLSCEAGQQKIGGQRPAFFPDPGSNFLRPTAPATLSKARGGITYEILPIAINSSGRDYYAGGRPIPWIPQVRQLAEVLSKHVGILQEEDLFTILRDGQARGILRTRQDPAKVFKYYLKILKGAGAVRTV